MRTLRPIIDRFIDDVLGVVRGATLDELDELLASSHGTQPKALKVDPLGRLRVRGAAETVTRTLQGDAVSDHRYPSPEIEISDPERLLGAAWGAERGR